jgi:hypothetical protein
MERRYITSAAIAVDGAMPFSRDASEVTDDGT